MDFIPTRQAGRARLADFAPDAGRRYAATRNHDNGPQRDNVSLLSPWLHAGLIGETEVLEEILSHHSHSQAGKFVSEVFWRVYFKGYLEQRPSIWRDYCAQRDVAFARLDDDTDRSAAYEKAVAGRTGVAAFDYWARELAEHGYIHNHARMWFASIWIFTLELDWTLGADFFLRHLMDGDAASNTLNWRWVAGLHTKGRTYLARSSNISRYTADHPEGPLAAAGLAGKAPALEDSAEHARREPDWPAPLDPAAFDTPYALLLHDEAASHALLELPQPPALVIGAARPDARSPRPVGEHARRFASGAVEHGLAEAADAFSCPARSWQHDDGIEDLLEGSGAERIVTGYLPVGWTRDALWPELEPLAREGRLLQHLPALQRATFPLAKAGYFGVRKQIPALMREAGIAGAG